MQFVNYISGQGPDGMFMDEGPDPQPAAHEILVEVHATALNRADLLQRQGRYPPPPGASPVLGLEMAGRVRATGAKVTRWRPGDRVCGLLSGGGYATLATIHEAMALPMPRNMGFEEAAAIPEVFLTAFQALRFLAALQAGERLLLHAGASGVGTAATQLARAMEAEVWVTASAPKHDLCRQLGAAHAIDYRSSSFEEVVHEQTQGEGVDVIIDPVGAPYLHANIRTLRTDGRLVLLAFMGGTKVDAFSLAPLLRKRLHLMGTTLRTRSLEYKIHLNDAFETFAWPLVTRGEIVPVIDSVFPWSEVAKAHRRMEANANAGKIVLRVE